MSLKVQRTEITINVNSFDDGLGLGLGLAFANDDWALNVAFDNFCSCVCLVRCYGLRENVFKY